MERTDRQLEEMIIQFKEQYEEVYFSSFGDEEFIWRTLGRKEYRYIVNYAINRDDAYERVCQAAVLWPEVDFSTYKAYIPDQLAPDILNESGFGEFRKEIPLLENFRSQMDMFDNQAEVIVNFAFPNISFEEMANWTKERLMKYVARAEWQLKVLRNIDLNLISDREQEPDHPEEQFEEPTLQDMAKELRENGQDPMLVLKDLITVPPDDYVERPLIGGYKQIDTMISDTESWKESEETPYGRYDTIREQVQKISRRRSRSLSSG